MQCKIIHHIGYGFLCSLKVRRNLTKNNKFLAHSKRLFVYALYLKTPQELRPNFLQMKKHNRVKFHQYSIVVTKLKFCVLILHPCRAHLWSAFYLFIRQIYSGFAENFIRGIIPAEQVSV